MVEIYNVCRNCDDYTVVGFDGYCSKECKKMDLYAALNRVDDASYVDDESWLHHGPNGEGGRTRIVPADPYDENSDDLEAM